MFFRRKFPVVHKTEISGSAFLDKWFLLVSRVKESFWVTVKELVETFTLRFVSRRCPGTCFFSRLYVSKLGDAALKQDTCRDVSCVVSVDQPLTEALDGRCWRVGAGKSLGQDGNPLLCGDD